MRTVFGIVALVALSAVQARADVSYDFTSGGLGFTTGGFPSWVHGGAFSPPGGTAWSASSGISTANTLTSPLLTVTAAGVITGSFDHRFNFESGFDGGVIAFERNGSGWFTIPTSLWGAPVGTGVDRFTGTSSGWATPSYITTTFTIGSLFSGGAIVFAAGDIIQFRFNAGWDSSIVNPSPNWQIGRLSLTNVTPAPGAGLVLAAGAWTAARRRRERSDPL